MQAFYGMIPPRAGFARAAEAARRAVELDAELAEGFAARAGPRFFADHDFAGAEADMRRALALSPSLAVGRLALADLLQATGRGTAALAQMEEALRLGPLDVGLNMNLADHLVFARRWDEAIAQYRRTMRMEPGLRRAALRLARACAQAGRGREAGRALEEARALPGPPAGAEEAYLLALLGRGEEAAELASRQEDRPETLPGQAVDLAQAWAALGNRDRAFAWLDRALEERHGLIVFAAVDPAFECVRDDRRFAALLRRIGLSPPA